MGSRFTFRGADEPRRDARPNAQIRRVAAKARAEHCANNNTLPPASSGAVLLQVVPVGPPGPGSFWLAEPSRRPGARGAHPSHREAAASARPAAHARPGLPARMAFPGLDSASEFG